MEEHTYANITTASLQQRLKEQIAALAAIAEELPGVVILHNITTWAVEYISERGAAILGASQKEIREMGQEYYTRFFNPEDAKDYVPKIMALLERNNNEEVISFFQQVREKNRQDWTWYLSTTKIFMRNEEGHPLITITFACPVDPLHHVTSKVSRVLEENEFLRKHSQQFRKLTKREREVLKLLAEGKSTHDISNELFISSTTVETHRKNIKRKLKVNSTYELSQYARAFDLI